MPEETPPPPGANAGSEAGPSVENCCEVLNFKMIKIINIHELIPALKIILLILGLLLCVTMLIFCIATLNTCPTNPYLPVTILVQGMLSTGMPTVFLFKYHVNATREKISHITFLVIFWLSFVASICCLITCTHFLNISGCKDEDVYKGGIFFVVIPWLAVIALVIGLIIYMYRYSTRNDVVPFS